jgi:fused signal recognition particle receptor
MASPAPATAEREVAFEDRRAGQPEAPLEVRPRRTEDLTKTLGAGLEATRRPLLAWIGGLRSGRVADDARFDELEEVLLRADVGLGPTEVLVSTVREAVRRGNAKGADEVVELLRNRIAELLRRPIDDVGGELRFDTGVVNVWLFVGVNGVGKTTTIAKVARRERLRGRSVLLAAADTFRAAAQEQLATWAERVGVDLVPGRVGGDPAAVVFDAVQRAAARGHDLVLADTAGRLHTKANLMEELKKVRRVAARKPGRVTEVLLVIDATTGQNGLVQARRFVEAVGVTGVVLTKLDGSAKGGIVVAIAEELGVPVKLVGLGEGIDDLADFDPTGFAEALVGGR